MVLQIIVLSLSIVLASVQAQDSTSKRPVLGGLKPIEKDSDDWTKALDLAKFSLTSLESSSGTNEKLKLVKVTEAYKQVVAGMMYHLTLEVSDLKGDSKTCKIKVVEQPWISPKPKVVDAICDNKPLTVSV